MPLVPPRVKGPLSECSSKVRVQGQIPGSEVEVVEVGSGDVVLPATPATGSDQAFTLTASITAGERIAARQVVGTDSSDLTPGPEQVEVQQKPSTIGGVSFPTPLFECGRCVWVDGLVPGADVELRESAGSLGSGESITGYARFGVKPLPAGNDVEAQQTACGEPGTVTQAPTVEPAHGREQGRVLPAPEIGEPVKRCERRALVEGVFPGATVRLMRSGGPDRTACFDRSALWFGVTPHFAEGETLRAEQSFPDCELFGSPSDPVTVGPLGPIAKPGLMGPLCAGATTVTVTNLRFGAHVYIHVAEGGHHGDALPTGATVYEGSAPDDGTFDFPIPPLPAGALVWVQQELCGVRSAASNAVHVMEAPASLDAPVIPEPVFECATVVHVENLHPGTRVEVFSRDVAAPIGAAQVYDEEADVTVAPMLQAGDVIWAVARGCGHVSDRSAEVEVRELEQLGPPRIEEPVYACYDHVTVLDVVPGARVDVFVDGIWAGSKVSGTDEVEVPVQVGTLDVGDLVTARQLLCGRTSETSRPVRVTEFLGRWVQIGGDKEAEILAVHAGLLPSGKIVYFGGDQHNKSAANPGGDVDHTRLFDCATHDITPVTGLPDNADLFCAGHALLHDGRLLAAGGTLRWAFARDGDHLHRGHFPGIRASYRFEFDPPGSEQWQATATELVTARPSSVTSGGDIENTGGRWYPTLVTLPDCRVLAMGGHPLPDDLRHTNTSLELYDPDTDRWSIVGSSDYANIPGATEVPGRGRHSEYPRLFVLPDGSVLSVSTMDDGQIERWNPGDDATDWDWVVGPPPEEGDEDGFYRGNPQPSTPVLLPLLIEEEYRARVLLCGAQTCYLLDPLSPAPSWYATGGRVMQDYPEPGLHDPNRKYMNATLLPSGEVFVSGGTHDGKDATGVKKGEMYDPATDRWTVLPEAQTVRNYHSVALLMPNGAVWHAGSNVDARSGGESVRNLTIEVFEPWYFCEDRPRITQAGSRVCHGEKLYIRTEDANKVGRVVLIRCGTATHAFNPDQRFVSVPFTQDEWDLVTAHVPDEPAVLVPGYYLCFIVDGNNVPSEGEFVQVCKSEGAGPGFDWTRFDWWNLMDWRLREYLRLDLIGARRLRDLLRATLEGADRGGDADAGSSEEKLARLSTRLARFERRLERLDDEIRKARERDAEPGKGKRRKGKEYAAEDPDEDDTRGPQGHD